VEESLTVEEALRTYTVNAAYASFARIGLEGLKRGSLLILWFCLMIC
jgi:predicted amidohydrolase YtcJ